MLDSKFAEAWVNKPKYRIMGRTLRPFCLWHKFLLEFYENPLFDARAGDPEPIHLEIAIRCCTTRYLEVPNTKKTPIRTALRFAGRRITKALEIFAAYIEDYNQQPDLWNKGKKGSTTGPPPDTLRIATACMAANVQGGDERYIWELPIGRANYYSSAYLYHKGAEIDYVTEQNRRMMADLMKRKEAGEFDDDDTEEKEKEDYITTSDGRTLKRVDPDEQGRRNQR